jgi:hypothetical protein
MRRSTCQFIATSAISVIALFGAGVPHSAEAALSVFNSRSAFDALGQVTSVDWGVFGAGGTGISTPAFQTIGSLTVGIASSQGVLTRQNEGTQFIGNFAIGNHLLTDGGSKSDTFIVSFGAPVIGFGTQVEPDYIRGAFTGDIMVFSPTDVLLGDIAISGNATNAEDNSAPFYGVKSTGADIGFAEFFVDQQSPLLPAGAIAINTMDVLQVPEPSSLVLLATAIFGIFGFRRVR